jgi:hypothetical protein
VLRRSLPVIDQSTPKLGLALVARSSLALAGLSAGLSVVEDFEIVAQAASLTALRSISGTPIDAVLWATDSASGVEMFERSEPAPYPIVLLLPESIFDDEFDELIASSRAHAVAKAMRAGLIQA